MIVASVLLILVAVMFLALGLLGGSSSLLIASIVASLLAAVALVIGARQAAAARRAAEPQTSPPDAPDPSASGGRRWGRPGREDRQAPSDVHDSAPAQSASAADSGTSARAAEPADDFSVPPAAEPAGAARDADPDAVAEPGSGPAPVHVAEPTTRVSDTSARTAPRAAEAPAAGPPAAETPPARSAADTVPGLFTVGRSADEGRARSADEARAAGARDAAAESGRVHDAADYQRASSTIGAARSAPAAPEEPHWARPAAADAPVDEFGEPDAEDPDDEPLPQAVRPTDAVLVARLDSEVLVVDGRPRYHLADCPHLVGRLTEPLPAAEAVELGFSPCGLCRPVDRLVAATLRH